MSTKWIRTIVLIAAIGCTGWAHSRLPLTTEGDLDVEFVPSPQVARAASFGFKAILADFHWLKAVQAVGGDQTVDAELARYLGKLIDVVTTLNPHVGHPYRFAAVWLTHDEELVRDAIRLLERAVEYHPDDWRNYFYLGFDHFFYLAEYAEAAKAIEIAMDLPGSPAYLPRLVARLKSEHADIDVAEVFLRELLRRTEDQEARARLQIALDEIEIEYKARLLDRAREVYRERVGHDIASVEDLVRPPNRVLERLPSPEPDGIPASLSRGSVWQIDPKDGRIESSYLGSRYEIHYSDVDRERLRLRSERPRTGKSKQEAMSADG